MELRVMFLLVLALVIFCPNSEARSLEKFNIAAYSNVASGELCEICEEYSTEALYYLNQNETQTEILSLLHQTCSKLSSLSQQCVTMVDYYVPLFFVEFSNMTPEDFCAKVHLCKGNSVIRLRSSEDTCEVCDQFVAKLLTKLKDPDTQVEIIEMLIKGCTKVKNMIPKCNKLVSQYGPEIIVNAETFVETTDICASTLACKTGGTNENIHSIS